MFMFSSNLSLHRKDMLFLIIARVRHAIIGCPLVFHFEFQLHSGLSARQLAMLFATLIACWRMWWLTWARGTITDVMQNRRLLVCFTVLRFVPSESVNAWWLNAFVDVCPQSFRTQRNFASNLSLHYGMFSLYFNLSFPVFFLSSVLMFPDLHTVLNNLDSVENNLRHSAKGSFDAYDVSVSLTGYEPNDMVFNELGNSQGSFSYITPSSDLDIDDATLGKLFTEPHREYAIRKACQSVSRHCLLCSIEQGNLWEKVWWWGNRPGWRRSRLRSCTGGSLSRSHRQSWGKGGRRGRAGSRERWRENTQGTLRMSMDGMTMEDKCERLEPCGVMSDHTKTLKTACRCAQFCMLCMSMCVVSFLFTLSTMVSMKVLKVYLSLYTLLRSHLFVNFCIRRYSLYTPRRWQ